MTHSATPYGKNRSNRHTSGNRGIQGVEGYHPKRLYNQVRQCLRRRISWQKFDDNIWKSIYSNPEELCRDIARAYRKILFGLYSEGCRFVQLDECLGLMMYAGGKNICYRVEPISKDISHYRLTSTMIPTGRTLLRHDHCTHYVCRGSYDSPRYRRVDYSFIAPRLLPKATRICFYLDLNVDSDNDYSILRHMPDGKK